MRRRTFVASVPATLVATAGCVGLRPGDPKIDGEPSLEVRSRECGTGDDDGALPRWSPEPRRILVEGTIVGKDGCSTARLAEASHDLEASSLTVVVETTADPGATDCTKCLTAIDYFAAIPFAGGLPKSVTVEHRGARNSTRTVTRKS